MGRAARRPAYTPIDAAFAAGPPARVPTLILHGSRDGANPSMTSEGHDDRFTGKYQRVMIEDAGHLLPREQPARVVEEILRWDTKPGPRTTS